jgi:hypothetical protein|tara:strand:- start:261 stop:599 length:339 start_codon:yes stop_codon:yes gene_type:complete
MNSLEEVKKIAALTEAINREAYLCKAEVESLIDDRKELIEQKYGDHREKGLSQVDAKSKATCDIEVGKLKDQIKQSRIKAAESWAKKLGHEDYVKLLIGYNSTKREELKQGL